MIGHTCAHCGLAVYVPSRASARGMGIKPGRLICVDGRRGGPDGLTCTRPEGHEIVPESDVSTPGIVR